MKKIAIILLFSIVLVNNSFSQNRSVKLIPLDYCWSSKPPLPFFKGDTIAVSCDTTYIVNKSRYLFYKKIHEATLSNNKDLVTTKLLTAYEQRLLEHQADYDKLLINSKQAEKINLELIDSTKKTLLSTEKTLDFTQKSLDESIKELEKAKKDIQDQKWTSIKQKLMVGAGGVGVGLLVGILIAK